MGHWQQISRDNAEERKRRAALPGWRLKLAVYGVTAFLAVAWIAVIMVLLKVLRIL